MLAKLPQLPGFHAPLLAQFFGLVDLRAVWDRLRDLGFHDDPAQIGPSKADLRDWLAAFSGRKTPFPRPPFALDDRSRALLGLRNRITIRPRALT